MNRGSRYVAVVTARGGSRGLPGKNIMPLGGRPLIAHSIEAALGDARLGVPWVTTDDAAIAQAARAAGARVIDRPAHLATDTASSVDTVIHALDVLAASGQRPTHVVLLQPTSPLRTAAHVTACLDGFESSAARSAVSACPAEHHPLKMLLQGPDGPAPVSGDWDDLHAPRQALPEALRINGAIYVTRCEDLRAQRRFVIAPLHVYRMSVADSTDIDTAQDLAEAARVLAGRQA